MNTLLLEILKTVRSIYCLLLTIQKEILALNSIIFLGCWSSSVAYVINDSVAYNGVLYKCIKASTNNIPSSSPTYWTAIGSTLCISDGGTY